MNCLRVYERTHVEHLAPGRGVGALADFDRCLELDVKLDVATRRWQKVSSEITKCFRCDESIVRTRYGASPSTSRMTSCPWRP